MPYGIPTEYLINTTPNEPDIPLIGCLRMVPGDKIGLPRFIKIYHRFLPRLFWWLILGKLWSTGFNSIYRNHYMTVAKVSFQLDLFQGHDYSIINYYWFLKVIFCYKSLFWNIQKVYELVYKALVPLSTIRRSSILSLNGNYF